MIRKFLQLAAKAFNGPRETEEDEDDSLDDSEG
jgi:hypothetical protein